MDYLIDPEPIDCVSLILFAFLYFYTIYGVLAARILEWFAVLQSVGLQSVRLELATEQQL